jgi:hypothetical protein
VGVAINVLKIREYGKPAPMENARHRDVAKLLETRYKWLLRTF